MAYAWLRTSEIALGEIRSIDEEAARHAPGVLEILTYRNVGKAVGLPDLLYQ
jgi:CO/xanthine dehydrogenase Mo-binding subunit